MPRPVAYPIRKIVSFDQEMLDAVGQFRTRQRIGTEVEAVRRLIGRGLAGTAERLILPPDLEQTVEAWRQQNAPGLELEEVFGLLLQRGIARATVPDLRPILVPTRPAAPPAQVASREASVLGLSFDAETESRIERFRRELISPLSREELLQRLLVVFEDGLESDVEDFRCDAMPEGTRAAAIERLVKVGLAEVNGEAVPTKL